MNSKRSSFPWAYRLCAFSIGVASFINGAMANTLFVGNNGTDSGTCGDSTNPCRSITRAISNAEPGDTIVVGAGRYGDVNGDGDFVDTGDEPAENGTGCDCMIKVNKQVNLLSASGARSTVLDAAVQSVHVMRVEASGVVIGGKGKGFTFTGSDSGNSGLEIANGTTNVAAVSNLAVNNDAHGFLVNGAGHLLAGNMSTGNGGNGVELKGDGHSLLGGVMIGNGAQGVSISGSNHLVAGSVINANDSEGVEVLNGTGHQVLNSSMVGNRSHGVLISWSGAGVTISHNNIYGNNSADFNGITGCGVLNTSGGAINATDNYWGTNTGPGTDPADDACVNGGGSSLTTTPFATKQVKSKVKLSL